MTTSQRCFTSCIFTVSKAIWQHHRDVFTSCIFTVSKAIWQHHRNVFTSCIFTVSKAIWQHHRDVFTSMRRAIRDMQPSKLYVIIYVSNFIIFNNCCLVYHVQICLNRYDQWTCHFNIQWFVDQLPSERIRVIFQGRYVKGG